MCNQLDIQVDHWLSFSIGPLSCSQEFQDSVLYLDNLLGPVTFLVANKLTIADLAVWTTLYSKYDTLYIQCVNCLYLYIV